MPACGDGLATDWVPVKQIVRWLAAWLADSGWLAGMDFIDLHGFSWIFIDFPGFSWIFMVFH